jgi:CRISPR-associated protein Cmr1
MHKKTIMKRDGTKVITVPGRSHWPEADSIRRLTGSALAPPAGGAPSGVPADEDPRDHSTPVVPEDLIPAFPKAVLGLPINFHFADGPSKGRPGERNKDPQDVQLVPLLASKAGRLETAERMASPVITRPALVDGKWRPAVVVFAAAHLTDLQGRLIGKSAMAGGANLSVDVPGDQIRDPRLGRLRPMRGQASALDALMKYLVGEASFEEITR